MRAFMLVLLVAVAAYGQEVPEARVSDQAADEKAVPVRQIGVFKAPRVGVNALSNDSLLLNGTTSAPIIQMTGTELYQGLSDTNGLAMLLGVNRTTNRQLWLVDTARMSVNNTNPALRLNLAASSGQISAIATDGATPLPLVLNLSGGNVGIGVGSPGSKLSVLSSTNGVAAVFGQLSSTYTSVAPYVSETAVTAAKYTAVSAGVSQPGTEIAARGVSWLTDAGTLDSAYGLYGEVGIYPSNAGTLTNGYGLYSRVNKWDGTITNGYALFLDNVVATNGWGVFQTGTDDKNYFGGNVSIGSTSQNGKLTIANAADLTYALNIGSTPTVEANATQGDIAAYVYGGQVVNSGISNGGSMTALRSRGVLNGPGTLYWTTGMLIESGIQAGATGAVSNAVGADITVMNGSGTVTTGYGLRINDVPATNDYAIYQVDTSDTNYLAGNVVIGPANPPVPYATLLDVNGNLNVLGSITGASVVGAVYQDVAEWVPASVDMEPGTVVVLNQDSTNEVMPSHSAYDTTVAGVVSAQPGVILGRAGASKEQIATTGRVKVRVDATRAPIRVGDLLVTSDIAGTAMRSEPMEINGRRLHQPGTIIGKALEPLASGEGEILVLLSLQ